MNKEPLFVLSTFSTLHVSLTKGNRILNLFGLLYIFVQLKGIKTHRPRINSLSSLTPSIRVVMKGGRGRSSFRSTETPTVNHPSLVAPTHVTHGRTGPWDPKYDTKETSGPDSVTRTIGHDLRIVTNHRREDRRPHEPKGSVRHGIRLSREATLRKEDTSHTPLQTSVKVGLLGGSGSVAPGGQVHVRDGVLEVGPEAGPDSVVLLRESSIPPRVK